MKLSDYFLKTNKDIPSDATLISHKLMIKSCMIKQTTSGIYTWLPLGLKVIQKIENIVRNFHNSYGCHEILMPTIQQSEIWKKSGRYDDYGPEMLKFLDRNKKELLYGPTNEELITDIFKDYINSYKDLPKNLYQIQWKFRDEIRPRYGVMRCREFLMKDNYSFDLTKKGADISYNNMFKCYLHIFNHMGLKVIPVRADPGAIGGDMSHEFHILTESGDTEIFYDKKFNNISDISAISSFNFLRNMYSVTKDKYNKNDKELNKIELIKANGIEVGHIFYFGTKYSKKLGAYVLNDKGQKNDLEMGSYGIGISRLVAAIIESSHDDNGIIWPKEVSPFDVGLINLNIKNSNLNKIANDIYKNLIKENIDVLYDNTSSSPGEKFANMDLIGVPNQIIVGEKNLKNNLVEIKNRSSKKINKVNIKNIKEILKHI